MAGIASPFSAVSVSPKLIFFWMETGRLPGSKRPTIPLIFLSRGRIFFKTGKDFQIMKAVQRPKKNPLIISFLRLLNKDWNVQKKARIFRRRKFIRNFKIKDWPVK